MGLRDDTIATYGAGTNVWRDWAARVGAHAAANAAAKTSGAGGLADG